MEGNQSTPMNVVPTPQREWLIRKHLMRLLWAFIGCTLLSGWFYWFQYRPSLISAQCHEDSTLKAQDIYKQRADDADSGDMMKKAKQGWYLPNDYEQYYTQCMRAHGIY